MSQHTIACPATRALLIKTSGVALSDRTLSDALTCVSRGQSHRQIAPAKAIALHRAALALALPAPRVWHLRLDWRDLWPDLAPLGDTQ